LNPRFGPRAGSRLPSALLVGALLLGACGQDADEAAPTTSEPRQTTGTAAATPDPQPPGRIADECPPVEGALDIPAVWPGEPLNAVAGADPLEIDLSVAIDAGCLVIADTYAAALPVATPNLGSIEVVDGRTIAFSPPDLPGDPARPETPWWGQDRVRACTNVGNGRLGCTNLDIDVWRADVLDLADAFDSASRPRLLSPLTRGDSEGNGTSIAGLARLQDAFGATWALSLVSAALAERSAPDAIAESCAALGIDPETLWPAAERILDQFAAIVDISSVELTTVMGREPPDDLSATSNEAIAAATAWADCQVAS
jgi:hypothetical protein